MRDILSYLQEHYHIRTLGDITWAHAVNSKEKLRRALNNPHIMMLEADVSISVHGNAVLAHPPETDSDLSFDEFIQKMAVSRQGVKLDFKDPEILIPCLTKLSEVELRQPVLLNADIFQGNRAHPTKFSAVGFLALCKKLYPQGILSPGWTTQADPSAGYTQENIDDMLALCQGVPQVTFPVRACLLPTSWQHVSRLIQQDGYSLTIWNSEPVDTELHGWLQKNTDPINTCYDCIDEHNNPVKGW